MNIETSCLCGQVRLQLEGEPKAQFYCHCDDCQAVHGAAYIGIALYHRTQVKILEGDTTTWVYKSNPRTRCANCGTILFGEPPGTSLRGVKANLLPEGVFRPEFHIHCRYTGIPLADHLPHYRDLQLMFRGSGETMEW